MAVSDRRYAAEVLDREGNLFKFDDVGCMAAFLRSRRPQIGAAYVADYETRAWVRAEDARYVEAAAFHTPMAHGIVAFGDAARAESAASRHAGRVLHFAELAGVDRD
jgi:copper chaperone NosL